jgi:CubicO group peptidase (beta-lactamase class C family)
MSRPVPRLLFALLLASVARAGGLESEVARLAKPYVDERKIVGLSIGVVRGDETHLAGFGNVAFDKGAPDADTVYEIGSISKVFTGILLAGMAADGKVRLDQPVAELLPDKTQVPRFGDRAITLADLSTHTSALPRMPDNFRPKDPRNPYADYSVAQMYDFLARCRLGRAPGTKYAYSNLGAGLLGHALARRAGKEYEALLRERITKPLGMRSTVIVLTDDLRGRLAQGYSAMGLAAENWDIPTLAGAGGIRSTARDMVAWLRANFTDNGAFAAARKVRFKGPPALGLGWHVAPDGKTRWHNGQTGGYHSFAAVNVEKKTAVVVLSNTATHEVDRLGNRLLAALSKENRRNAEAQK